jgi:hypothetical protein
MWRFDSSLTHHLNARTNLKGRTMAARTNVRYPGTTYVDLPSLAKPPHATLPDDLYWVEFSDVPPHLTFLLAKRPKFRTKGEAFIALRHYEFEFGVYGNVFSKFGMEPDDLPMQVEPVNDNIAADEGYALNQEDIPQ